MDNLPVSWTEKRLGEITTKPQYGYTASASSQKNGPKFVRITDITKENIDWEKVPYCECSREDLQKYKLELNDLLFARTGSTGSSILITELPEPAVFASYLIRLKIKKGIEAEYLDHFFKSWFYWKQIESLKVGAVQSGINASVLSSLKIPVPLLVEQRGIVEVLGTMDECIRLTDAVIERAEELKRGLMQQLLTRGIGHTEYKETPLGEIPKTWTIMKISKIASTSSGGTPSRKNPDFYNGSIPWIKSGELNSEEIFQTEECITEEALKKSSTKMVPKNTLLIAMYGATAGQVAITRIDASINQAIASIIPKKDHAITLFLLYSLQFFSKRIISRTQGSGQPNLSQTVIKNIELALPALYEQKQIVSILSVIDEKIKNEKRIKENFIIIKQGLMQQLLSGKIRVELKGDGLHRIGDRRETNN